MNGFETLADLFLKMTSMWTIEDGAFVAVGLLVYGTVYLWGTSRNEGVKSTWRQVFGLLLQAVLWVYLQAAVVHYKLVEDLVFSYAALAVVAPLATFAVARYTRDSRWMMVTSGLLGGVIAFGALLALRFGRVPLGLAMVMGTWLGAIAGLCVRTVRFAGMAGPGGPDGESTETGAPGPKHRKKGEWSV